jgi:hypothetical protein
MTAQIGFNLSSDFGKPIGVVTTIIGLIALVITHFSKHKKANVAGEL